MPTKKLWPIDTWPLRPMMIIRPTMATASAATSLMLMIWKFWKLVAIQMISRATRMRSR